MLAEVVRSFLDRINTIYKAMDIDEHPVNPENPVQNLTEGTKGAE